MDYIRKRVEPYDFTVNRAEELKKEYIIIDENWLAIHFKVATCLCIVAGLVEFALGLYVLRTELVTSSVPVYFVKYLLIPSVLNGLFLVLGILLMKNSKATQKQKIVGISFMLTVICFVLTTVHNIYIPIYAIYVIPILLTSVYASPALTQNLSVASIVFFFISEFIIKWDPDTQNFFSSPLRFVGIVLLVTLIVLFSILSVIASNYLQKKHSASIHLEFERGRLEKQLRYDELTGIYNRVALNVALKAVEEDEEEHQYILAMIDLDGFKKINDQFGHPVGDTILKEFANILKENEHNYLPFRFGGDEFCLLFQDRTIEQASETCRKIKESLLTFTVHEYHEINFTASFGLSQYSSQIDVAELFVRADFALYNAKNTEDQVVAFENI